MFKTFFLKLILYVKLWVLEAGGFPRLENTYLRDLLSYFFLM
jgi:hypothetical protein